MVARGITPTHEHLRSRLTFLFVATVVLDAIASVLVFMFERHANGTQITTLGDSIFWTSTQLLTVSSQLPNPISTPARVLDVFLQAYAISAVAIIAGSLIMGLWGMVFAIPTVVVVKTAVETLFKELRDYRMI